ncbi:MBL fold metallo-hydrolase [Nesterenkonia flava]|uniref:MBL fold metallo-hydrolase n=1 Tax=Nesterenkonia flava TaxID=469799 RepID=A0ABU1FS21_9MICC|nr:MBL fold metallo-hydrolase [Nesterenkonia flava]MDR5711451.1 MBL fold metallo-hydrolase [Nesterenkonia flava]
MKLTIVGNSGSFPGPASPASCYLLSAEHQGRTWRIILDLGNGAIGALQRHIALETLDAVALSHLHPDHFMDLCGLHVAVRWRPGGWPSDKIPVYGPTGTHERITSAYGLGEDETMDADFDFHIWTAGQAETVGPFTITPIKVRHTIDEPYALRVQVTEDGVTKTLTYSGDTDACDSLVEAAQDADLFLCEAAFEDGRDDHIEGIHLNGTRAGQMAARAGAKRLLLTHIPVWTDAKVVRSHAAKHYDGELGTTVPGTTYEI